MKTAIVFYSLEGSTKRIAEKLAAALDADIIELKCEKEYPSKGFKKFFFGGKSSVFGETPALLPYEFKETDYDAVILGAPIWAGNFAPPLRTFLAEKEISDKKIGMFVCCCGGSAKKSFQSIKDCIGCYAGNIAAAMRFSETYKLSDEQLDAKVALFVERFVEG